MFPLSTFEIFSTFESGGIISFGVPPPRFTVLPLCRGRVMEWKKRKAIPLQAADGLGLSILRVYKL